MIDPKLSTVHDALNESLFDADREAMIQGSYRIDKEIKEAAEKICEANGTSLSRFVRNCVLALVRDYVPGVDHERREQE